MALKIDLKDRIALVTGVTDGIGAGVAAELAAAGCHVAGCGRRNADSAGARAFLDAVESTGRKAAYCVADVCHRQDIERFIAGTVEQFGKLDLVVSNAGSNVFKGTRTCSEEDWQANLDLNFTAHWRLGQGVYEHLKKSGNGCYIIMGSNHAYSTIPGCSPYSITKSGLLGMVQSMAIEWGPDIRVLGLAPGFIDTKLNEEWLASFPNAKLERQKTVDRHPVRRLGSPREIGGFCAFLASPYAAFATGTTYLVDGGRSAIMQDD